MLVGHPGRGGDPTELRGRGGLTGSGFPRNDQLIDALPVEKILESDPTARIDRREPARVGAA